MQSTKCRVIDGWSGTLGIKEAETGRCLNEYEEREGGGCLDLRAVILLALSSVHTTSLICYTWLHCHEKIGKIGQV